MTDLFGSTVTVGMRDFNGQTRKGDDERGRERSKYILIKYIFVQKITGMEGKFFLYKKICLIQKGGRRL